MTIRDRRNGCGYFDNTEVERIDHGDDDYGDLEIYYACGCRYVYDYIFYLLPKCIGSRLCTIFCLKCSNFFN